MSGDDHWRHWSGSDEGSPEGEDGVLDAFLDRLEPARAPAKVPGATTGEPESPAPPADSGPGPDDGAQVAPPPEPAEPPPGPEATPLPEPEAPAPPEPVALAPALEPAGTTDPPVSFVDWIEARGDEAGTQLKRLGGRFDDGVVAMGPGPRRGRGLRIVLLGLVGAAVLSGGYVWLQGAEVASWRWGRASDSEEAAEPGGDEAGDLTGHLRQRVQAMEPIDFGTVEELEDALFRALANQETGPERVRVEALATHGSPDVYERRPTRANLVIELGPIPGQGDEAVDLLSERLIASWLTVGRLMDRGGITFEEVQIRVPPPLRWDRRYPGERLADLWRGALSADDLLAEGRAR